MGKSSDQVAGYRFKLRNHAGLTFGPLDAYLEFRGGDKPAWRGRHTASGTLSVNAPNLWGGDKDQGGIVGDLYVMMGEATQVPNPMLVAALGNQVAAWRGFATVAFDGIYGSNNPYPQPQSHKVEKILKGWDGDVCWYPEKAAIAVVNGDVFISDLAFPATSAAVGPYAGVVINSGFDAGDTLIVEKPAGLTYQAFSHWNSDHNTSAIPVTGSADLTWTNRVSVDIDGTTTQYWPEWYASAAAAEAGVAGRKILLTGSDHYTFYIEDNVPADNRGGLSIKVYKNGSLAINAAHALYYLRTQSHLGGEPTANIDDASFTAAADQLFAEGFGICVRIETDKESVEDVENRICKLIGGSVNRSLTDGKLYLDLARGDYVLADLPIVTDDDILDFSEQPTSPEGAVNSVSVRYFDPQRKETIITPSVDALGLIDEFGLNHQVIDYPEIPTADLAARIATRELMDYITPSRVFDLVCKPTIYALRPNQYFRLQAPKRGITDMVCIVGDKQGGTLKSGAIRMQAAQDIYTLPSFGTVEIETGVDTSPATTPSAITSQLSFEAPFVNVSPLLSKADLDALDPDVGYLMAIAEDPAASRDFTLAVDAGAGYAIQADGDWCPTLEVVEAAAIEDPLPTAFTFTNGSRLDEVAVGDAGLWGDEIVRLDAIDIGAGTLTLGRGCADTVPQAHAAGDKLWFYGDAAAKDTTQYTDSETIAVKLLTNTFSQQLPEASASAIGITFAGRLSRPYPPGQVAVGGSPAPTSVTGDIVVTWAPRDRDLQADQLVDHAAAGVGPAADTRWALRFYDASDALLVEKLDIDGTTATAALSVTEDVRMELYAVNDNGDSWQVHERTFAYTSSGGTDTITAATWTAPTWVIDGNGA